MEPSKHQHNQFHHLGDDMLVNIFCFSTVKDFLTIHITCHDWNQLTDVYVRPYLNNCYWKRMCHFLCSGIHPNYSTSEWHLFYKELCTKFLINRPPVCGKISRLTNASSHNDHLQSSQLQASKIPHFALRGTRKLPPLQSAIRDDCVHVFDMLVCWNEIAAPNGILTLATDLAKKYEYVLNGLTCLDIAYHFNSDQIIDFILSSKWNDINGELINRICSRSPFGLNLKYHQSAQKFFKYNGHPEPSLLFMQLIDNGMFVYAIQLTKHKNFEYGYLINNLNNGKKTKTEEAGDIMFKRIIKGMARRWSRQDNWIQNAHGNYKRLSMKDVFELILITAETFDWTPTLADLRFFLQKLRIYNNLDDVASVIDIVEYLVIDYASKLNIYDIYKLISDSITIVEDKDNDNCNSNDNNADSLVCNLIKLFLSYAVKNNIKYCGNSKDIIGWYPYTKWHDHTLFGLHKNEYENSVLNQKYMEYDIKDDINVNIIINTGWYTKHGYRYRWMVEGCKNYCNMFRAACLSNYLYLILYIYDSLTEYVNKQKKHLQKNNENSDMDDRMHQQAAKQVQMYFDSSCAYIVACDYIDVKMNIIRTLVTHCSDYVNILQTIKCEKSDHTHQRGSYFFKKRFMQTKRVNKKNIEMLVWQQSEQEFYQWLVSKENQAALETNVTQK